MKILHLNTYDGNGGAGRASYRLNKALIASGIDSKLSTYVKFGSNEEIQPLYPGIISKTLAIVNILAERYLPKLYEKNVKVPFSLQLFGKDIHKHPALKNVDIIHLHWINHGFLSPKSLGSLAKLNKPIVWTMHDCNTFTGGCHVRFGCENYIHECGNCPFLKNAGVNDISHRTLLRKKNSYNKLDLNFISPSNWLAKSAIKSSLLKDFPIKVIPNTLETNLFKPSDKIEAKESLHLDKNKFIILSGFMPSKKDSHKGTSYLIDALDKWLIEYPEMKEKAILVIFGNKNSQDMPAFGIPTKFLGIINNDEHLAKAYVSADLFLTPSLDDNLPNTVMESMACGTPVVAFRTGGIPDMVDHEINGYLAEYKNTEDFMNGIQWIYKHKNPISLAKEARLKIVNTFSEEKIAKQHINLYQSLLNSTPSNKDSY